MNVEYVSIGGLIVIIILLIIDRYFINEQNQKKEEKLLDELSKMAKAVISKNANDYVMTTSIDKVPTEDKPTQPPDIVPEESVSDDEFFEAIGKGLKEKK